MKLSIYSGLAFIIMAVLALAGCRRESVDVGDFDKTVYAPQYASGFEIKGADGRQSTLITVSNPWQGADSIRTRLFIARGDEKAPEGFDGQVLEGDAKRIVVMSSTHIAMLDVLGSANKVVGVSGKDFISNEKVRTNKNVGDIGFDGNVNYELLLSLEPDLVLLYGVNGASSMENKLKELKIPYMYVGDYLEESPLGKAEWLVAVAEVTGQREKGTKVFSGIPERYNALKKMVADAALPAPKVMLNTPYNDTWFMPSAESYAVRLISDAGGDFIYKKNTGNASAPVDMEEAYVLASKADVWLYPGQARNLDEVRKMVPKFTDTPPLRNGRIFNNNRRLSPAGGNDYFESAVIRPDVVLRDLIKIFHPELVREEFVYHKQMK